jgi:hypothetical protein
MIELLNLLDAATREKLLEALNAAEDAKAKREVQDLRAKVTASQESPTCFDIEISNSANSPYKNLRVMYESTLLWAERFGLDTTHMPEEWQYQEGEPILIEELAPHSSIKFRREAYGNLVRYDGPRSTKFDLVYDFEGTHSTPEDKRWCQADISLPNAR